jgi:hypothetical protein
MMDLSEGQVWRAKKPANSGGLVNDRVILRINFLGDVQYDGPAVARGRHYPIVSRVTFEKWCGRDVTKELPKDDWQPWDFSDTSKNK